MPVEMRGLDDNLDQWLPRNWGLKKLYLILVEMLISAKKLKHVRYKNERGRFNFDARNVPLLAFFSKLPQLSNHIYRFVVGSVETKIIQC